MSFVTLPFATDPLYKALECWEEAWDTETGGSTVTEDWTYNGFMQNSREFAVLARVHLDQAASFSNHQKGEDGRVIGGMTALDQTSMSQVTDLMLNVQFS